MTSDRARVTYDPSRRYHGVVAQQGRVSLEADWNEAQAIAGAELAARTLDVVGRAGSPDRGYEITPVADERRATGDLLVRAGTLYVGGQRVRIAAAMSATPTSQTGPTTRETRCGATPAVPRHPHELVYLLAREQEVSAVEDPALRDVALGGPDTTQRLRILPRVVRHPTTARTWEDAWGQLIEEQWRPHGFGVDEASRDAACPARGCRSPPFTRTATEQPADHGGYLGPNNQLIRVQIARVDHDGVPVLVWGYDNASFLYRLSSSVVSASAHRPPAGHRSGRRVPPAQGAPGRRGAAQRRAPRPRGRLRRGRHRPGRAGRRGLRPGQQGGRGRHRAPTGVPEEAGGRACRCSCASGRAKSGARRGRSTSSAAPASASG